VSTNTFVQSTGGQPFAKVVSVFRKGELRSEQQLLPFSLQHEVPIEVVHAGGKLLTAQTAKFKWPGK